MNYFIGTIIGIVTFRVLLIFFDLITNRYNKKRWIRVSKINKNKE